MIEWRNSDSIPWCNEVLPIIAKSMKKAARMKTLVQKVCGSMWYTMVISVGEDGTATLSTMQ